MSTRRRNICSRYEIIRGGSRTATVSKMERFLIVNDFQPLNIITKHSISDVAAVVDPPLIIETMVGNSIK